MKRVCLSISTAVIKSLPMLRNFNNRNTKPSRARSYADAGAGRLLQRSTCVVLLISLLTTSTPAAPQTIVGVAREWQVSLAFWWRANALSARLYQRLADQNSPRARRQEKQAERDAHISEIKIFPANVTLRIDEKVSFSATAYDGSGSPVGGVKIKWSAQDNGRNKPVRISQRGDFEATVPGSFHVTAEGAGQTAQVKVTVLDIARHRRKNEAPVRSDPISTRDQPRITKNAGAQAERHAAHSSPSGEKRSRGISPKPMAMQSLPDDGGWGPDNYTTADDPMNRRGQPLGAPVDGGAGSSNFQFAAPLLNLAGRGIDISLGLAGNSRLWNKAGSQINYDIDRDWPAPGFSMGFGKLLGMNGGSMLVDPDGTRHAFTGSFTTYSWGANFVGHTTDGSLIDYWHWTNAVGAVISGQAKLPNGTIIDYGAPGPGGVFPTRITDPNGNYITVTYVSNAGPRIQTVTDTLGRVINFYYDANSLLTAITAPGLDNSAPRTLARLHYKQQSLNYSFSGLTAIVRDANPWLIDAIYYPGTATGYWFGDSDSYSTYGMLAKVVEQRGIGFSASSLTEQGSVTPGQLTRQEAYNFPLYVADTSGTVSSNLTDAPTYTSMTETWMRDGINTDQATTTYSGQTNANPRTVTITLPNGTTNTQYSYNSGDFHDGLVYLAETRDAAGTLLQSNSSIWEQGAYDSPRPTRVEATDERGQTTATTFTYGSSYNQVTEVRNYDYGGSNLLRSTHTEYQNNANYTNRHIFNLPLATELRGPDNTGRLWRTEFPYDGQTLTDTPNVVMHNAASNPYSPPTYFPGNCYYDCTVPIGDPCIYTCEPGYSTPEYDFSTDYRGNVTQTTTYADAANLTGAIAETRRYDITGNLVSASTSCCEQTSFNYTVDTQFAYPLSKLRGSATDAYAQVSTSATYDFNTGLPRSATDANGRSSQSSYDDATLRLQTVSLPSGSHSDYAYDDTAMTVSESTYLSAHPSDTGLASQSVKHLNGLGQVRQEKALGASGVWDFVDTVYDNLGRVSQQSRPYRSGDTLQWSTSTYDALGRVTNVQAPDGSTTQTFYNETSGPSIASSDPGDTTRVRDAWGRERWAAPTPAVAWSRLSSPTRPAMARSPLADWSRPTPTTHSVI